MWSFLIAFIFAYLLFPLIQKLEKKGIKREYATLGAFFANSIVTLIVVIIYFPILLSELKNLIRDLPFYFDSIFFKTEQLATYFGLRIHIDREIALQYVRQFVENFGAESLNQISRLLTQALSNIVNFILLLMNLFLIPVFFYYIIIQYEKIVFLIKELVPLRYRDQFNIFMDKLNEILKGYLRGQLSVAFILAIIYSAGLSLVGLPFGFLIGLFTGLFYIIPYVGVISGFVISMLVALAFSSHYLLYIAVICLFVFVQALEGFYLTPKIVGNKVGLNPLQTMLGIFIFGSLFGLIGMLVAIPASGIIKYLIQMQVDLYKKSQFYLRG